MQFTRMLNIREPFGSERNCNAYKIVPLAARADAIVSRSQQYPEEI
jgi:hypothetical protein